MRDAAFEITPPSIDPVIEARIRAAMGTPEIVVIHGSTSTRPDYMLYVVEDGLPGADLSEYPEARRDLTTLRQELEARLAAASVEHPWVLCTHSLFVLNYITVSMMERPRSVCWIGLHSVAEGLAGAERVQLMMASELEGTGSIVALDEELALNERYMDLRMKLAATGR